VICPRCNSGDTASCAMVYAQGTSSGQISASGIAYDRGYVVGQAYGSMSSSSALAQVVAPPQRLRLGQIGCLNLVVAIVLSLPAFLFLNFVMPQGTMNGSLMMLPGILLLPFFLMHYVRQRIRHDAELKRWAATWMCLRCGNRWVPTDKEGA
jgi:hypothetical protein